jgi:hypothetical protein
MWKREQIIKLLKTLNSFGTLNLPLYLHNKEVPNIVVESLTLLLRIWEVPGSKFGPETSYPE